MGAITSGARDAGRPRACGDGGVTALDRVEDGDGARARCASCPTRRPARSGTAAAVWAPARDARAPGPAGPTGAAGVEGPRRAWPRRAGRRGWRRRSRGRSRGPIERVFHRRWPDPRASGRAARPRCTTPRGPRTRRRPRVNRASAGSRRRPPSPRAWCSACARPSSVRSSPAPRAGAPDGIGPPPRSPRRWPRRGRCRGPGRRSRTGSRTSLPAPSVKRSGPCVTRSVAAPRAGVNTIGPSRRTAAARSRCARAAMA